MTCDEDSFLLELEQTLTKADLSKADRIQNAKELCRNTNNKIATGAYFALDALDE